MLILISADAFEQTECRKELRKEKAAAKSLSRNKRQYHQIVATKDGISGCSHSPWMLKMEFLKEE